MATANASRPIVSLTEAAAARVRRILERDDQPGRMLRVGVRGGGCAGMIYAMELVHESQPGDELVKDKGVSLLIDAKAVLFLLGTCIDYDSGKLSSGFRFNNPNQIGACGCGESVSITPAPSKASPSST